MGIGMTSLLYHLMVPLNLLLAQPEKAGRIIVNNVSLLLLGQEQGRPDRLDRKKANNRRKAIQEFRRQKSAGLLGDSEVGKAVIDWSPEQLERIWQNTTE